MLLRHTPGEELVEALDPREVFDPFVKTISVRMQAGEDTMDMGRCSKSDLCFPSGEPLPLCWRDSHYREHTRS